MITTKILLFIVSIRLNILGDAYVYLFEISEKVSSLSICCKHVHNEMASTRSVHSTTKDDLQE